MDNEALARLEPRLRADFAKLDEELKKVATFGKICMFFALFICFHCATVHTLSKIHFCRLFCILKFESTKWPFALFAGV
jgi:hypothetical protein